MENLIPHKLSSETGNPIPPSRSREFSLLLNRRLTAARDLQEQLRKGHLNVAGSDFEELHELFDKISAAIHAYSESISTRLAHLRDCHEEMPGKASSAISENPPPIKDVLNAVLLAHSAFGQEVRGSVHEEEDSHSADLKGIVTEVSQGVDKWLWFVETHIQKKPPGV